MLPPNEQLPLSTFSGLSIIVLAASGCVHLSRAAGFRPSRHLRFPSVILALFLICTPNARANGAANPTTTLTVAPGTSITQGTALTLQASVSSGGSAVTTGGVTFYDGATVLAPVQVVYSGTAFTQGTANLKVFLGPGTHDIKAVFGHTSAYHASTSSTETVTVTAASAATTLTTVTSTGAAGNYTLKGQVMALSSVAPTGNVSFSDQSNSNFALGTSALDPATLTSGWQTRTPFVSAAPNYGIIVGDLNGDGIPDIVTSNYSGTTISVFVGNGDGTYQTHADYTSLTYPFGMAIGDLNGDGFPDLVLAYHYTGNNGGKIGVFLGNGDGTLQPRVDYDNAGISEYVALGDFNNDGKLDVVALNSSSSPAKVNIFLGNGDGTLQALTAYNAVAYSYGLAVGDFNGDGNLDVAVANYNSTNGSVSVLLGNGNGTLAAQTAYPTGSYSMNVRAVDLNNDGKLDLVVANFGSSSVSVLMGVGDGTFQPKVDYPAGASPWGLAIADVNGDGMVDVVATNPGSRTVTLLQGNGDGTLKAAVATSTLATNYLLALADLNGDGVIDLAVPNLGASSMIVSLGSISETATLAGVSVPGGGSHAVVAGYAGDNNSSASTSTPINLTGTRFPTSTSLDISPAASAHGQGVLLTATVTPSTSSGYTAAGTVNFSDGASPIGSAASVAGGQATLTKSDFTIGGHDITAAYSGDTNFIASSTASPSVLLVNKDTQTITFPAMAAVTLGVVPLTLSATSDSSLAVAFSVVSGPATISDNVLSITGGGSVVIQASQAGDATYQAATPVRVTLTVNKHASTSTLSSSSDHTNLHASITFTATAASPLSMEPSGSFAFMDGTTSLGSAGVNAQGVATRSVSTLTAGTHSITAIYSGDTNFLTSTSTALSQVIVAPDYSITANPSTLTLHRGQYGTSTLTITPTGGYTGAIGFACTGLPAHSICTPSPATAQLTGDNQPKTILLTVGTSGPSASLRPNRSSNSPSMAALALLSPFGLLTFITIARPHRKRGIRHLFIRLSLGIAVCVLAGLTMTSCGANRYTTPIGVSSVTVSAAAVGGSTSHTASITITVTE